MFEEKIDVREDNLIAYSETVLKVLLKDRSTNKNIIWATNDYFELYSEGFESYQQIRVASVSGLFGEIVQPRIAKSKDKQLERTKIKAEVFTPAWICNKQNNLIDEAWFGRKNVFNKEVGTTWETNYDPIQFDSVDKAWQDYVLSNRLEITCGEAPYIVSRYDNASGLDIPLKDRVGFLDRKLRIVCENVKTKEDWLKWALIALQSSYGFDFQGDNVLLARENVLYTYVDFYKYFFNDEPPKKLVEEIAKVISWNIWQMDGLTWKPPYITKDENILEKPLPFCRIMDWKENKKIMVKKLLQSK